MRKLLLASHGRLAEGAWDSLRLILGEQENLETLCAYTSPELDLDQQIDEVLQRLGENDEIIVVTDLLGGSVNNRWLLRLSDPRIHLVAGLNLGLLVELVNGQHAQDTAQMISEAIKNSNTIIRYCNILHPPVEDNF